MATEITISYNDSIVVDQGTNERLIKWHEKGNAFPDIGNDIHYFIYNTLPGGDEVQRKDPTTLMMTGNTTINSVNDEVGNGVTVQDLLDWATTRVTQIEAAEAAYDTAVTDDENNGTTNATGKTWADYDPHYS